MSTVQAAAVDAALKNVISAVDTASLAKSCFYDLAEMFEAIKKLSDEHSTVHALAGIGKYLADDWGGMHDRQREQLASEIEPLRALKVA